MPQVVTRNDEQLDQITRGKAAAQETDVKEVVEQYLSGVSGLDVDVISVIGPADESDGYYEVTFVVEVPREAVEAALA